MLSQEEIKSLILPILREKGRRYKKSKQVLAKKAKREERIETITSDGVETVNRADEGDYVVENMTEANEKYVVSEEDFRKRYQFLARLRSDYSIYEPKNRIYAISVDSKLLKDLDLPNQFYFEASWGANMKVEKGDFLVCPLDYVEVYRVAKREFLETYTSDEN